MNDKTELRNPDWDYWRIRGAARLPEAVLLSLDIEPKQKIGELWNGGESGAYNATTIRMRHGVSSSGSFIGSALDSVSTGSGQAFIDRMSMAEGQMPGEVQTVPETGFIKGYITITTHCTVSLSEFADWAAAKRLTMPPELAGMASGPIPESRLSMVMNENHPGHSKELAGAIHAWLAVNIDDEGNKQDTPKNRMLAHAKKQGFVGKALERIATVCNPETRKSGGRT